MRVFLTLGLLLAAGCGFETIDEASCPPGGTKLTYAGFASPFFTAYCNSCHSAGTGERKGAPDNYVFNTREQIVEHKARVYVRSAGINDSMPPGPDDPPLEARQKLGEWLVCGAP